MCKKRLTIILFLSLTFSALMVDCLSSDNNEFSLEVEKNWDTYGIGGTCIPGTHNIFVADVDDDNVKEIMTGGFSYNYTNGSRSIGQAPLRVWSWNGQNITLKASLNWYGSITCLYAADVDSDGKVEILTSGPFSIDTGNFTSSLRIWNINSQQLSLKAHYEGVPVSSMFVSDIDDDGTAEIITVGRSTANSSQLCLWHIQERSLTLQQRFSLQAANVTSANSVYATDLDNDGNVEVVIGGYSNPLSNSKGLISIWQMIGQEFTLKAYKNWQSSAGSGKTIAGGTQGNTAVNTIKAGDLDDDGVIEVVTGGFTYNGTKVNAQLKIWNLDISGLIEKASHEWATDYLTEVKGISLDDADGNGRLEVVQSGMTAAENSFKNDEAPHDRGQLRVWSYNGTNLILIASKDWTFDEGACAWNVANGDIDNDGVTEIITVGCTALNDQCDPDMRIWSLPIRENANPNELLYYAVPVLLLIVVLLTIYLYTRKRSRSRKSNGFSKLYLNSKNNVDLRQSLKLFALVINQFT